MRKKAEKNLPDTPESSPATLETPPDSVLEPDAPQITVESATEPEEEEEPSQPEPDGQPITRKKPGPKPGAASEPPTIWDRIAIMKEGEHAYVYRQQPFTNKLMNGQRSIHVRRYDVAFDAEELLDYAGSGCYNIQLVERQVDGKSKRIATSDVKLLDYKRPPKIPPGEWVDDPRNKEWEWAKEFIFPKKEEAAPRVDPYADLMKEMIRSQREEIAALRADMNKKDPGEKSLLAILAEKVLEKPTPPPPDPIMLALLNKLAQPDPMQAQFMTFLIQQNQNTQTQLQALLTKPAEPPKDELSVLERQLDFQKKLRDLSPNETGGRSKKSGLQETMVEMTEAAAPVLAPLAQAAGMLIMQAARAKAQAEQQAAQGQPQTQQAAALPEPEMQEVHAPPQQNGTPAPGPKIVPRKPTTEAVAAAVLKHVQSGWTGHELGDWFLKQYGSDEFDEFRRQGTANIIATLQGSPLWRDLSGYAASGALEELIGDLITYVPPDDEEEDEDDDEEEEQQPPIAAETSNDPIAAGWETKR